MGGEALDVTGVGQDGGGADGADAGDGHEGLAGWGDEVADVLVEVADLLVALDALAGVLADGFDEGLLVGAGGGVEVLAGELLPDV